MSSTTETKAEAEVAGLQMAIDRGVEHVIKKLDHHWREQHLYLSAQPGQESTQGIAIGR
jgi:hypothetical protein